MKVHVLHNNTKTPEGRMAIYDRMGEGPRTLPGDTLTYVGTLDVPEVGTSDWPKAADITFEAGNSPHESERMWQYRSWQVGSLCVGDVLVFPVRRRRDLDRGLRSRRLGVATQPDRLHGRELAG